MKHTLTLLTLLTLAACAPGVSPSVARPEPEFAVVTLEVDEPLELASLIISSEAAPVTKAMVPDERCADGPAVEGLTPFVACELGDLTPDQAVRVRVNTPLPVSCLAGGYLSDSPTSYVAIPCKAE